MTSTIDKAVYLKLWHQINPSNQPHINTSKTIHWIQALIQTQKLIKNQTQIVHHLTNSKKNFNQDKNHQKNSLQNQNPNQQKNPNQGQISIPQNDTKNSKSIHKNKNKKPSQTQIPLNTPQNLINSSNLQLQTTQIITQEIIFSYIQKYSQTDHYKMLPKPQPLSQPQPPKQEKQKKSLSKQPPKKTKKNQPKIPQTKFDENIISLTYEEAIFFFYWFKIVYEKDSKESFIEKMQKQHQNQDSQQLNKSENPDSKQNLSAQNKYQPKLFLDLTQREISFINEDSFLSLKQHEPKLAILFKHYAKLSHVLTKQATTFQERNSLEKALTLHQWMLFCKDWNILNAKNINEGWESGKVTREFLMDVYYKNSVHRKEMSFQMFLRAIISVSCRMYHDCDVFKVKPIDLMLNFLTIKNELKFIENLETKNISYRQGEILSCFKAKDRDAFDKMNIIKVTEKEEFKKSHFTLLRQKNYGEKLEGKNSYGYSHKTERNEQKELEKSPSEANMKGQHQIILSENNLGMDKNYSTGALSKVGMSRRNRKSAPEIGVKLPSIEQNKFFNPIPQNGHMNKFREYIRNEVGESSSVLRSKITGYHKIYGIQSREEEERMGLKNRMEHMKISKVIGGKLGELMGEERVNPEIGGGREKGSEKGRLQF